MLFLFLSIISSTGIFLIFRLVDRFGIPTFRVIVINYFFAALLGFLLSRNHSSAILTAPVSFYFLAVLTGVLFILMFFIVGLSSQKAGMAVTTVAGKMSVIFPMIFSLLIDPDDVFTLLKGAGIILALTGVLLTLYKKKQLVPDRSIIYLPLGLFIGMGIVDSLVKYSQYLYVSDENLSFFAALLFSISAICGIIISIIRKDRIDRYLSPGVLISGILLGTVNFGSIYFIIRALNFRSEINQTTGSSIIFGINNIGIVCLSVLLGLVLFREKLNSLNILGIFLALLAIIILSYSA